MSLCPLTLALSLKGEGTLKKTGRRIKEYEQI
jgi:hypothetical protein